MDEHTHNVALFFGLTPEGGGVPENMAEAVAKATKAAVLSAAKDVSKNCTRSSEWDSANAVREILRRARNDSNTLNIPTISTSL